MLQSYLSSIRIPGSSSGYQLSFLEPTYLRRSHPLDPIALSTPSEQLNILVGFDYIFLWRNEWCGCQESLWFSYFFAATSIRRGPSIPSGWPISGNISVPLLDLDTLSLFHALLMLF